MAQDHVADKDLFAHKAQQYEQEQNNIDNVERIAQAILSRIELKPEMQLMDFGSGTGLLLERIAHKVQKITAVDVSAAMNQQLQAKQAHLPCELAILPINLISTPLAQRFDGIISSLTLHHIEDIEGIFQQFHTLLKPGGFIALADLDPEDGSFHDGDDTGVFHHGFEHQALTAIATRTGFQRINIQQASVAKEPQGLYPVFLLTGFR
ncbi:MAG: methyltransferase domain-containing protein [Marinobacterium sp.]|nr:methyltransferase domain-containing protein [Marinobacterium sp.]